MDINRKSLDALFKGFNTQFLEGFGAAPDTWGKFAKAVQSGAATNVYPFLEQFGGMREWIGDRQVKNLASRKIEVVNRDFEDTVSVSRNDIEDDQYGVYGSLISQMGFNAAKLWQDLAVNALLGPGAWIDGLPFFSASRSYGDNAIVNGVATALSAESYAAARKTMMAYKGHNGKYMGVAPTLLIVGPDLEATAFSILKDRMQVSFAAESGTNGYAATDNPWAGSAEYLVVPELSGSHASTWFLAAASGLTKPVIVQQRKRPTLARLDRDTDENVFQRREYVYGTDARGEAFLAFPHLIYRGGVAL
jgi:phage major head subunit gpT-like protein